MKHTKDSRKHYDNVVAAQDYFSELQGTKQDAFDEKSDRWKEGEKGQEAEEAINQLESAADALQTSVDELDSLFESE